MAKRGRRTSEPPKITDEAKLSGDRLQAAIEGIGLSQTEFAKEFGMLQSTISNYVQGIRHLPVRAAKRFEKRLKTPAAYLMGVVDELDMELLKLPKEVRAAMLRMHATSVGREPSDPESQASPFPKDPLGTVRRRSAGS